VQNEAETPYFSIFKNLGPVEISTGNRFWCQNLKKKNASKSTKISDFEGNPVEISEVLPVEISTKKSGQISIFTGKKN